MQITNELFFPYRVSQDERELAKYGSSPFVGLNLVLENLGKDDNDVVKENDTDVNEENDVVDSSSKRIVKKGDKVWVIRQDKEV